MNIQNRLKRWFKLRFAILYPFCIFAVIFANCDDKSLMAGIWFILAGLFLRIWANGYAIKLEKLSTCGPYAFIRHPLYLGTMFIIIGFIIMLKVYYAGLLLLIVMIAIYKTTIKKEEGMLEQKFKDLYIDYKKKVPAMIPTVFPYREGEKWPFSFRRLIKSQEYKPLIWIIILVIVFYLKYKLMIQHQAVNAKMISLIIAGFMLGSADLISEFLKHKNQKTFQK